MSVGAGSPELALAALAAFCRFLLLSCGGWGLCVLLMRLATSAAARFTLSCAYLAAVAALWLSLLAGLAFTAALPPLPSMAGGGAAPRITVLVPGSWMPGVAFALPAAAAIYLFGAGLLAALGLWRRRQLARALSFRFLPPPEVAALFQQLAAELGVRGSRVWLLPGLTTPAAIGSRRPGVYLPEACREAAPGLASILHHELCHIRRRDHLWEALARLCRVLLFFHPCVHRAFAALRFERELACDLEVVRTSPGERDRYADTLVRFGWMTSEARVPDHIGVRFAARPSVLHTRVQWILAGERTYSRASRRRRLLSGAAGLWLFAALAPALSLGVSLVRAALPSAPVTLLAPRPAHGRTAARPANRAQPRPPLSLSAASVPGLALPDVPPSLPPEVHYAGPHEERQTAKQRNFEQVEQAEDGSGAAPAGAAQPTRGLKRPTTRTSILIGAAVALGRFGLGHIHDHDKD